MKIIDIDSWKRKIPYKNFVSYTNPAFSISTRLDVTPLVKFCKENKKSFFSSFLFIVTKCLNEVEELRIRIKGDNVVLYDKVNPSYVVMNDSGVICTNMTKYSPSFSEFYNNNRADVAYAEKQTMGDNFSINSDNDCFYVSCLPWIDVTSVINPYDFKDKDGTSIPRLLWGRFVEENGRYKMGFDVSAHHGLTDGKPICDFINNISENIANIENLAK